MPKKVRSDNVAGTASPPRPVTGFQQIVNKGMQIAGGVFNAERVVVEDQAHAFKVTHDRWSKQDQ